METFNIQDLNEALEHLTATSKIPPQPTIQCNKQFLESLYNKDPDTFELLIRNAVIYTTQAGLGFIDSKIPNP